MSVRSDYYQAPQAGGLGPHTFISHSLEAGSLRPGGLQTLFPVKASFLVHRWPKEKALAFSSSYKGTNLIMGPHHLI